MQEHDFIRRLGEALRNVTITARTFSPEVPQDQQMWINSDDERLDHALAVIEEYEAWKKANPEAVAPATTDTDEPALEMNAELDYTLTDGHLGAWIAVENISVKITRLEDGVRVALYPRGEEMEPELDVAEATWDDAREAIAETEAATPAAAEVAPGDRFTAQFGPYSAGDAYDLDDLPVPQTLASPPAA